MLQAVGPDHPISTGERTPVTTSANSKPKVETATNFVADTVKSTNEQVLSAVKQTTTMSMETASAMLESLQQARPVAALAADDPVHADQGRPRPAAQRRLRRHRKPAVVPARCGHRNDRPVRPGGRGSLSAQRVGEPGRAGSRSLHPGAAKARQPVDPSSRRSGSNFESLPESAGAGVARAVGAGLEFTRPGAGPVGRGAAGPGRPAAGCPRTGRSHRRRTARWCAGDGRAIRDDSRLSDSQKRALLGYRT